MQQTGQAELAGAAEQGGDMAAGARVEDADGGGAGADDGAAAEQQGDGICCFSVCFSGFYQIIP